MHPNSNLRKVTRIFILVFLCCEMQSSFTQQSVSENLSHRRARRLHGLEVSQEHAKHQASIRLRAQDGHFGEGHICSGAIIAPSVVLTVAQCIYDYDEQSTRHPAELQVVMGSVNRYQRTAHTLVYGVTHVYWPQTFDPHRLRDNIAMLQLEWDVPEQHPYVQPIALNAEQPYDTDTGVRTLSEAVFEVTSWGATVEGVPTSQLISLNASKTGDQRCMQTYGALYAVGMVCFDFRPLDGKLLHHACPIDNGAPLLYKNQLWGLNAVRDLDCQMRTAPFIYTDVGYHSQWILEKVGDGHHRNDSFWGTVGFLLLTLIALKTSRFMKF